MQAQTTIEATSGRWKQVTGYVLSGLVVLFLLMDASMKLVPLQVVLDTQVTLGWPAHLARTLGVILLVCTILYMIPRTALLGAILLTAYLGGAIATHVRIESPLLTHTLFGVYLALAMWGGLWLRSERLRALLPIAS